MVKEALKKVTKDTTKKCKRTMSDSFRDNQKLSYGAAFKSWKFSVKQFGKKKDYNMENGKESGIMERSR